MNAPEHDQHQMGLYRKFNVTRVDGTDQPGGKHYGDEHFVLNLTTDKNALPALAAYADACESKYPRLAADLRAKVAQIVDKMSDWVTVPETTLPNGMVVPSFPVMKHKASRGAGDIPVSTVDGMPWVEINYYDAKNAAERAGFKLLTSLQALALQWNIYNVADNWLSGQVGVGDMKQGLHKGTVSSAQPGTYVSPDPEEDRWFVLSTGERIQDVSGNAYEWLEDYLHGDERGLTGKIHADSPLLTTCPHPSMQNGTGWRPYGERNWSGRALVRGGHWCSGSRAGVFYLYRDWPGYGYGYLGFRCTK